MSDDIEARLHEAFRRASLPAAPSSLVDALERVPDAPVTRRRSRRSRSLWAPLAVAAVLGVASAIALSGGQRGVIPSLTSAPTTSATPPSEPPAQARSPLRIVFQAQPVDNVQPKSGDMEVIAGLVQRRLYSVGIRDAVVSSGEDRLVVELPAVNDPDRFRELVRQTGRIDFVPLGTDQKGLGDIIDPTRYPPLFSGDEIATAAVETDPNTGPIVTLVLKYAAVQPFDDYTSSHIGEYFAIVVDGRVMAAPQINSGIPGGHVQITVGGSFSPERAEDLVATIGSGTLPFPLREVTDGSTPSPSTP
jgi:preprotein translocase subunit SecD